MTLTQPQALALDHLRKAYLGPEQGELELLVDNRPSLQYIVGMLYPPESDATSNFSQVPDEKIGADVQDGDLDELDLTTPLASTWKPSSVAISFVVDSPSVLVDFSGATYDLENSAGCNQWQRVPFSHKGVQLGQVGQQRKRVNVGTFQVEIGSRWRPWGAGWLVTVHAKLLSDPDRPAADVSQMVFQVDLGVRPDVGGRLLEYDPAKVVDVDAESRELRLRYRNQNLFAVGHGVAADWELDDQGNCVRVYVDPVPNFVVPAIEATGSDVLSDQARRALSLEFLASIEEDLEVVVDSLTAFVDEFANWAQGQQLEAQRLGGEEAERIASRSLRTVERMREGVRILADETRETYRAFALAMKAMKLQMTRADHVRRKPSKSPAWRPFQLGFLLVAIASTVDSEHDDRELVDLIWFPTGGGKTEAYLALAAIEIFSRQLVLGKRGSGTTVITRYTLRLLAAQQFQRTAALICAMETMRLSDTRVQGMSPFNIGLWVGNDVTPGTRDQARDAVGRMRKSEHPQDSNYFQVTECPWCETSLLPENRQQNAEDYGPRLVGSNLEFFCLNMDCDFAGRKIPIVVVDDQIYANPPAILMSTVDKFARIQFKPEVGKLLGIGTPFEPPSLVIQDELHLLSGPLGTTVGAFDLLILQLIGQASMPPKIVASTATIRASRDQVNGLYGRSVSLYPPACLDGDENFFARPVSSGEGRMYVGLMPQSLAQATALVATSTPLFELPYVLRKADEPPSELDAYWTTVLYHNSLRELGRTDALLKDDVNARLIPRSERLSLDCRDIRADRVLELTSRKEANELPSDLRRLNFSIEDTDEAVDAVLSSNMLSVGIDVPRLSLMLMVGQPKTTAEYIQATSRVGRGEVKGIVVTLFRPNRARDRSQFETFRGFHAALYRGVEPSSVTPWSMSSRRRSLPGILVALIRNTFSHLSDDAAAGKFDLSDERFKLDLEELIGMLVDTVAKADPLERHAVYEESWRLFREWDEKAREVRQTGSALTYAHKTGSSMPSLLRQAGAPPGGWLVGSSMRSVEPNVGLEVDEWQGRRKYEKDSA